MLFCHPGRLTHKTGPYSSYIRKTRSYVLDKKTNFALLCFGPYSFCCFGSKYSERGRNTVGEKRHRNKSTLLFCYRGRVLRAKHTKDIKCTLRLFLVFNVVYGETDIFLQWIVVNYQVSHWIGHKQWHSGTLTYDKSHERCTDFFSSFCYWFFGMKKSYAPWLCD